MYHFRHLYLSSALLTAQSDIIFLYIFFYQLSSYIRHVRITTDCKAVFLLFTVPFNNTQTLKFKVQPTNAFFACSAVRLANAEHSFVFWIVFLITL